MDGLENRNAELDVPPGVVPTDPENLVTDNTQGLDDSIVVPIVRVDTDAIDLRELNGQLDRELVAAQEMLARYISLESWATVVDAYDAPLTPQMQIGTELLLNLTTQRANIKSEDVIPSLESFTDGKGVAGALRVYAKKLLAALIRLCEKITAMFEKIYEILTSRCRASRIQITAIKVKMGIAKGGRLKTRRLGMGRYSRFLAIRGMAIQTPSELYAGLGAVGKLADDSIVSHLNGLLWVGDEVIKITKSESFPNPRATEARLTRAFAELAKTSLAGDCTRQVGSDPRFQSKGYVTTASENLIGNRTLYLTKPRDGSEIADTFGTVSFEFTQTRLGDEDYEPKAGLTMETCDLSYAKRLLELCEKYIGVIERFDSSDPAKRLVASMSKIHTAVSERAKQGGLDSINAELLYSASVAFSAAATSPIRDIMGHLATAIDATLDVISRSLSAYD